MSRVSTIDRLPSGVRTEIDRRLIESGFSGYIELAKELNGRGYRKVSKSGLHRYGQQLERRIELGRAREQLEAAGIDPILAAELTGEATLVVIVDRRNARARLMNVAATPAEIIARLKEIDDQ
jgi:hypothetical protein